MLIQPQRLIQRAALVNAPAGGASEFIFQVITSAPDETFQLPLLATGSYNFDIDWGDASDDTITAYNQAETTHTYAAAGTYEVTINGALNQWSFAYAASPDAAKVGDIKNWGGSGNIVFGSPSGGGQFYGCTNLTLSATDVPNLSGQGVAGFLQDCISLSGALDLSGWDISGEATTQQFFNGCIGLTSIVVPAGMINTNCTANLANQIFKDCINLTTITGFENSDASNTGVFSLFQGCLSLLAVPISFLGLDFSSAYQFALAFNGATLLDPDISSLSNIDWTKLIASSFTGTFTGSAHSTTSYDALLNAIAGSAHANGVTLDTPATYSAAAAHAALITDGWTLNDGGAAG